MTALRLFSPASIAEAVALLAEWPEARCIAGGANLVAQLNAGSLKPAVLISLQSVAGLSGIARADDGSLHIAAMTRHAETAASAQFADGQAVVPAAARVIANPVVRNMGTIGGSVAFADPAADYPTALVASDASVVMAGSAGQRTVPARAFFLDCYTTALKPDEIVTAISVPPAPVGSVGLYRKLSRTHGDYAIAAVALVLGMQDGLVSHFACAVGACGPTPVRLQTLEAALLGRAPTPALLQHAGETLVAACDPVDDVRASAAYRRMVVPRLFASAVAQAQRSLCSGMAIA